MANASVAPDAESREARIIRAVTSWPGISTGVGDFGETEFFLAGRSIGHVHGDWQADIPFPRKLRDQLVAEGRAEPHHIHPESTWTTRRIHSDDDADDVVALLRLNYDRLTARHGTGS
jgi:hypothetical protein